jgi:hypothetical protein
LKTKKPEGTAMLVSSLRLVPVLLATQIRRKAGTELEVTVSKEASGYRIEPWKSSFLAKLPKDGQANKYRFEVDLKAMRYVTLRVNEKGAPLAGAKVTVGGKEAGVTDDKGELVYLYSRPSAKGAEFGIAKSGYGAYRAVHRFAPGEVIEVALNRQAVVTIEHKRRRQTGRQDRRAGRPHLYLPRRARQEGRDRARGARLYPLSLEDHRRARWPRRRPALFLSDYAKADPHRRVSRCR